jgi:hypothetical protein
MSGTLSRTAWREHGDFAESAGIPVDSASIAPMMQGYDILSYPMPQERQIGAAMPDIDLTPLVFVGALVVPGLIASLIGGGSDE